MRWSGSRVTASMLGATAIVVSTFSPSLPARASDEIERIAGCAAIEDSASRLRCYDDLVRGLRTDATGQDATPDSGWVLEEATTPEESARVLELRVSGDREVHGKGVTAIPSLVIRCTAGLMDATIELGMSAQQEYGGEGKTVLLRFDDDEIFKDRLEPRGDGTALGFSSSEMLVNQLLLHDALYFQFTPRNSRPASLTFDLRGLGPLFESVESDCGFRLDEKGILVPSK